MTVSGTIERSVTMSVFDIAQFHARRTWQLMTVGSAAMAAPRSLMVVTFLPKRQAKVCWPAGSQSVSCVIGVIGVGVCTWMAVWNTPAASNFANSGAMWFIVVWQFAQITDDVSWKLMGAPAPPEIELKAHGL